MIAVDALVALGQRRVVGVADELHEHVVPVAQVRDGLADLLDVGRRDLDGLLAEAQRRDDVLHARAPLVAVDVAQAADGLHAADLDAAELARRRAPRRAPSPCFTSSYQTSTSTRRFCARPASVAFDATGCVSPAHSYETPSAGKPERALQQLGDLAGALARQAFVVAEDGRECRRQRLRVGVTDEVQPHVAAVVHAVQDLAQLRDRAVGNLGDADGEVDRRHEVRELDRLELLGRDLAHLEAVAGLHVQEVRVVRPLGRLDLAGQMPLDGLAARRLAQELRLGRHAQRARRRAIQASGVARFARSFAISPAALARSGRLVAPPEHLGLDRELVARAGLAGALGPRGLDVAAQRLDARIDELRVLEIGEIRQAQHGRRRTQLLEQQLEPRLPELADLDRARLEHGVGEVEADDAMDRGAEVELEHLAARRALHLQRLRRAAVTARQRAVVELQHEVAAAALVRRDRAGDVEAAELIGRREQAARRREAHAGDAALALVLQAVAVLRRRTPCR